MTALNNERLRRANQVAEVSQVLKYHGLSSSVALALAEMVEGGAPAETIAREILRKDSTELFDLFLRYQGIHGFTRLILDAKASIDTLRRPIAGSKKETGHLELTSHGLVQHTESGTIPYKKEAL